MPDITVSPLPYNGGTLSMTHVNSHVCHLDGNRFFALFSQSNPNYLIASTFDVDLIATSPSVPVKQRIVEMSAPNRIRVWKLSSSHILALVGTDLRVFNVDASGDISITGATLANVHTNTLWGAEGAAVMGIGPMMQGRHIKENTVWFTQRTSTTSAVKLFKIDYNPGTNTLTKTDILTFVASTTATHMWRCFMQPIPNTTTLLVFAQGGATTWATAPINAYYIVDTNGTILQSVTTGIPTTVRMLGGLRQDRIIGFTKTNTWMMWDGSVWNPESFFAGANIAGSIMTNVVGLDPLHFALLSTSSATEASATSHSLRISRVLDPTFGQTSGATNTGNGVSTSITNAYFDQDVLLPLNSNTMIIVGRPTTTTFRVRSFYQA